jgi:hypothetical protein
MKVAAIALATISLAVAGSAAAASRATDVDYLRANRCKGLAAGLGSTDVSGIDAFLKVEGRSRAAYIEQRGEEEMKRAKRETSDANRKDRLVAELNGPCMAYVGPSKGIAVR